MRFSPGSTGFPRLLFSVSCLSMVTFSLYAREQIDMPRTLFTTAFQPAVHCVGIRSSNWPSTSYRIGSRLHRATPNMGILDESRFFTNPMVTALLNKNALVETINSFMSTEAVETV